MKFKKSLFGYNAKQVDKAIKEKTESDAKVMQQQKERIAELLKQNEELTKEVEKLRGDEEAVSRALVVSQELADKMKNDAEKFSDVVLTRAKIFYAAWQAYAQTMVAALSEKEVEMFNNLVRKVERLINSYDGKNINGETADLVRKVVLPEVETAASNARPNPIAAGIRPSNNPIKRLEQASGQAIDLRELIAPKQSLADICKDLGLVASDGELKLDLDATKGED